jgi:hypothetical protein
VLVLLAHARLQRRIAEDLPHGGGELRSFVEDSPSSSTKWAFVSR